MLDWSLLTMFGFTAVEKDSIQRAEKMAEPTLFYPKMSWATLLHILWVFEDGTAWKTPRSGLMWHRLFSQTVPAVGLKSVCWIGFTSETGCRHKHLGVTFAESVLGVALQMDSNILAFINAPADANEPMHNTATLFFPMRMWTNGCQVK